MDGKGSSHPPLSHKKASDELLQLAANPFVWPRLSAATVIPPLTGSLATPLNGKPHQSIHKSRFYNNILPIGFGSVQQQQFALDTKFAATFGIPSNGSTNGNLGFKKKYSSLS